MKAKNTLFFDPNFRLSQNYANSRKSKSSVDDLDRHDDIERRDDDLVTDF
jgi:hypothetical protein